MSSVKTTNGGGTYGGQESLPRLPIPSLEDTLTKFPKVLEALETEDERQATKKIVDQFLRKEGPELQKLLEEYDRQGQFGSYVEEFWTDSYLAPNDSVVLNLNPYFGLEASPKPQNMLQRAAALCFASCKFASLLKRQTLSPDLFKNKPLCMDQFRALFGSCRIPQGEKDSVAVYPESTHVAVLCRNQIYYFQALWPEADRNHDDDDDDSFLVAVNECDILDILEAIEKDAKEVSLEESAKTSLGVLTTLPRKEWASARDHLLHSSPVNKASLQILDSALFVLVLDADYQPDSIHATAANMLHGTYQLSENNQQQIGTCCNRWYDKLQIIVCQDGTAGVNFEHSGIDGHTALRFVSDIFAETIVSFAQSITKTIGAHGGVQALPHIIDATVKRAAVSSSSSSSSNNNNSPLDVMPKKLVFNLPSQFLRQIYFAETTLGDEIVAAETVVLEFEKYGKSLIVSNKMSPDSFVQMSMLLSYYRLYGKIVCAYEPVLTKQFYHGRTEAMRTATPEALRMCQIWTDPESSDGAKLDSLRTAAKEHSRLVRESAAGRGVDRHLFALKSIAARSGLGCPEFFRSEPWRKLNHTYLSTSNCGNPSLRLFGFGPVVPDGFGIGYIIKEDALSYSVCSKHRQTKRYVTMLERTLMDFKNLLQPTNTVRVREMAGTTATAAAVPAAPPEESSYDSWGETAPPIPAEDPKKRPFFSLVKRQASITRAMLQNVGQQVKLGNNESEGE